MRAWMQLPIGSVKPGMLVDGKVMRRLDDGGLEVCVCVCGGGGGGIAARYRNGWRV